MKHMDNVEKSKESVRAYKYDLDGTIYQRVWLAIGLLYDDTGLKIDKTPVSTVMDPDGITRSGQIRREDRRMRRQPLRTKTDRYNR